VTTTLAPEAPAAVRPHRQLPVWLPYALGVGALLLSYVLFGLAAGSGNVVVVVLAFPIFGVLLYGVARSIEGRRRALDRTVTTAVVSAFLVAIVPLVSLLYTVIDQGRHRFDVDFFTNTMRGVVGENYPGGAMHAIWGTVIITLLTAAISVPIGLLTSIYLVEYGKGRLASAITFLVDVMTGIPSIVAGLFAYTLFEIFFGPGIRLGIGGAVALSVLMIPIVVRSSEEMLKLVPMELREASYALGVPKWKTIVRVVLPVAAAGIATGVTIAVARVIGETAPLLLIVGNTVGLNYNPLDGRMQTLPVFIYYQYTQPGVPKQPALDRAWTAALVLIIIVLALNLLARFIAKAFAPKGAR
jgi:phosphate transport system permease protein